MDILLKDAFEFVKEKFDKKLTLNKFAEIIDVKSRQAVHTRMNMDASKSGSKMRKAEISLLEECYDTSLESLDTGNMNCVKIAFRPDVYLSAGYGATIYEEPKEYLALDEQLLITDRGTKINPRNCEILTVSGDSMSDRYIHGDRVIVDLSIKTFTDGFIYAFNYDGQSYMKEISVMPGKVKCISYNEAYDPFYIDLTKEAEKVNIIGRVLPRIRL